MRRRCLRVLLALLVALSVTTPLHSTESGDQPLLFVFATTDIRALKFEEELSREMPGVKVRVFCRIRDFEVALKRQAPDAILARQVVLESFGKRADLRGRRGPSTDEPYVLLSIGTQISPRDLADRTLGVVSIVGRNTMNAFVSSVLGVSVANLKHVNSERDLLSLLQFGEAQAALLSQWEADSLKKTSQADLKVTVLSNRVGLPSVSFASEAAKTAMAGRIRNLSKATNRRLGVDQWD